METTKSVTLSRPKNKLRFDWLVPVLLKPKQTLAAILEDPKPNWQTPLLAVGVFGFIELLVAGPIKKLAIQMGTNLPPGFEYYSAEQQQQFLQAQASQTSPLFLYVFSALGLVIGILITWFLLRSLLHLSLTVAGSRAKSMLSGNLAAWSFTPLVLRSVVRIIAMLATKSLVSVKGLAGLIEPSTGLGQFAYAFLAFIDIFFVWQILLLLFGSEKISNLPRIKAWGACAVAILILLILEAFPGFIGAQLSGLSFTRMFFF